MTSLLLGQKLKIIKSRKRQIPTCVHYDDNYFLNSMGQVPVAVICTQGLAEELLSSLFHYRTENLHILILSQTDMFRL